MIYNLEIIQGTTFIESVEIKTDINTPEDLTGSTFLLQIREYSFSPDYLINATDVNGLLDVSRVAGIVNIKLPPSETIKLVNKKAVYELIQTKPNGDKFRIISGDVNVQFGIAR